MASITSISRDQRVQPMGRKADKQDSRQKRGSRYDNDSTYHRRNSMSTTAIKRALSENQEVWQLQ
jgi:hypothetical protein